MSESLRTLKGVGEKTEKLFAKIGVTDVEDLIHYYPRTYDAYEEPVEIQTLEEGTVAAVSVTIITGVYVNHVRNLQVITITAADLTGKLPVTWFNMPYLKSVLKKGSTFVLRGRVTRKQGRLQMEHPEIFTHGAYEEILHSLQKDTTWQTVISPCLPYISRKICRSCLLQDDDWCLMSFCCLSWLSRC